MRTIKFRGQLSNGNFIFGDLVQWGGFEEPRICSWNNGVIYDIEPESVAQLVGYDKNGEEIYEGDRLCNPRDGTRFKASMNDIYTVKIYEKEAPDNA